MRRFLRSEDWCEADNERPETPHGFRGRVEVKEPGDSGVWAKSVNPMDVLIIVVGWVSSLPQIHVLNSENCAYVTLCGKKGLIQCE